MITFVVPIKSFRLGKQRLAGALDESARADLGRRLAQHVVDTVSTAGNRLVVVSSDEDVVDWAGRGGHRHMSDPGRGLDAAAMQAVDAVLHDRGSWVVIHSDLPLLSLDDVERLSSAVATGYEPISPSSDGGTTAIGSQERVTLAFGPSSFHRHLGRLTRPRILTSVGLGLDIDSPADLEAAAGVDPRWSRIR